MRSLRQRINQAVAVPQLKSEALGRAASNRSPILPWEGNMECTIRYFLKRSAARVHAIWVQCRSAIGCFSVSSRLNRGSKFLCIKHLHRVPTALGRVTYIYQSLIIMSVLDQLSCGGIRVCSTLLEAANIRCIAIHFSEASLCV